MKTVTPAVVLLVIAGMCIAFYAGVQYGKKTAPEDPYVYSSYESIEFRTNRTTGAKEIATPTGWHSD